MWESIKDIPRGRLSTRKLIGFVPALLVACFLYILFTAPTTFAVDATRKSDTILYDGKTYKEATSKDTSNGLGLKNDTVYYVNLEADDFINNTSGDVSVLTFAAESDPKTATEAELRTGTYNAQDGRFTGLSPPTTVTIAASGAQNTAVTPRTSCDLSGIGWMICPVSGWIADGVDFAYGVLSNFFVFESLTAGGQTNSIYNLWGYVRNIANVCFIIAFLIVIYSQMTSGAMSNYTVKKLLPRIIVAAILVNTSYWICAIGIDISNILGTSIQDFLKNIRGGLGAANTQDFPTWGDVTTNILAGGGIVLGTGAVIAAAGGTVGGLIFLLLAALVPAMFAVLVAVAILAARQALITVFIIIAPLAFVAYLLPNTEEWFNRWRKLFMTMLMMFPAFSLIFGASQLIGIIIIQNANDITVVLLGMTVQVVPLFITPFLIKLSSGLLGTIAGLANDNSKGVFDRTKNWANNNRELHRQRGLSKRPPQTRGGNFRPTAVAQRMNNRSLYREQMTAKHKAKAEAQFAETARGRQVYNRGKDGELLAHSAEAANQRAWTQQAYGANGMAHSNRAAMHHGAHVDSGVAKLTEERATAYAERDLQTQVSTNAALRDLKVQSDVDNAHAQFQTSNVTAEGKQVFQNQVMGDRALRLLNVQTVAFEKQATTLENTLKQRAEASWERTTSDASDPQFNQALRNMRLEETKSSDSLKKAEAQWSTLVENIRANGKSAPGIMNNDDKMIAGSIKRLTRDIEVESTAQDSAKREQQQNLAEAFKTDVKLQQAAAGIGGDKAIARVVAKAKSTVSGSFMEDVKNIQDTLDYDVARSNIRLRQAFDATDDDAQKIALAKAMSKNGGPGIESLRELFTDYETGHNTKKATAEKLDLFKEILAGESNIMSAGKDMEFFLTKSAYTDKEGKPTDKAGNLLPAGSPPIYKTFKEVSEDPRTWTNLSANAFAAQNATTQKFALNRLKAKGGTAYMEVIDNLRNNVNARAAIKKGIIKEFSIYGDDEYRTRDGQQPPDLPEPGTIVRR